MVAGPRSIEPSGMSACMSPCELADVSCRWGRAGRPRRPTRPPIGRWHRRSVPSRRRCRMRPRGFTCRRFVIGVGRVVMGLVARQWQIALYSPLAGDVIEIVTSLRTARGRRSSFPLLSGHRRMQAGGCNVKRGSMATDPQFQKYLSLEQIEDNAWGGPPADATLLFERLTSFAGSPLAPCRLKTCASCCRSKKALLCWCPSRLPSSSRTPSPKVTSTPATCSRQYSGFHNPIGSRPRAIHPYATDHRRGRKAWGSQ